SSDVCSSDLLSDDCELIPVTVVQAKPSIDLQKHTIENHGYEALQIGVEDKKETRATEAEKGHAAKANTAPKRYVREIRGANIDDYEVGQENRGEEFQPGDTIDVTGRTKGEG